MKKNAMLKIAAILMVAVLLTTCAISSTFAKYTTTDSSSDVARVAKFGVEVKTNVSSLFEKSYGTVGTSPDVNNDSTYDLELDGGAIVISDLVAPGTSNHLNLAQTVTGKPEVSVTVTNAVTFTLNGFTDAYCPIEFVINGKTYTTIGTAGDNIVVCNSISELLTEVNKAASTEVTYAANKDLDVQTTHDTVIGWQWRFNGTGIDDVKDTALGDAATAYVGVNVVTTVTQTGPAAAGNAAPAPAAG